MMKAELGLRVGLLLLGLDVLGCGEGCIVVGVTDGLAVLGLLLLGVDVLGVEVDGTQVGLTL